MTPVPVTIHTPVPSVTGDGVDMFCLRICRLPPLTVRLHRTDPSARFTHQSSTVSLLATLRKIRSFQMMGVEPDHAGIGRAQVTPSVFDHFTGSPVSVVVPFNAGPRHWGQFSAESAADPIRRQRRKVTEPFSTETPQQGTEEMKVTGGRIMYAKRRTDGIACLTRGEGPPPDRCVSRGSPELHKRPPP